MSPRLSSKLKVEEEVEDTDPTVASVMTSGNSSFIRRRFFPRVNSDESLNPPNDVPGRAAKPEEHTNKLQSFIVRTASTIALIGMMILFIYLGHIFLVSLIFSIQFLMVGELFKMARVAQESRALPGFRAQQWYFFFVATFYMYGRFVKDAIWHEITSHKHAMKVFGSILRSHTLIAFSLYVAGFVMFVLSLRKRMYLYQFGQYAWTHMILLTVFVPSSFFVSNTFEGLIWLLLPCCLVITNDITAYIAGFFWGRTPLIKLSPKKTWEGFIGGLVGTLLAAWFLSSFMGKFKWMTCPRMDLSLGALDCTHDPLYRPRTFTVADLDPWIPDFILDQLEELTHQPWMPSWPMDVLQSITFSAEPIQLHASAMAIFASIIGPFGGFFASGFKRALKIKDFGDSIPGHGGMTDRMDCQMLMGVFSYLWYQNIVNQTDVTVSDMMDMATSMSSTDRLELLSRLIEATSSEGPTLDWVRSLLCGSG